jgi:hypothetical protein
MRLPLAADPDDRAGEAQLFVPIARRVWATQDTGAAAHAHAAFLVGQPAARRPSGSIRGRACSIRSTSGCFPSRSPPDPP